MKILIILTTLALLEIITLRVMLYFNLIPAEATLQPQRKIRRHKK